MNDDFLFELREPPRREFAGALYKKMAQQEERGIATMRLRQRLLVAVGSALVLLVGAMFLAPGGPTAAAQGIEQGAKLIVLGAYSTAQKIEASVTGRPLPDDSWDVALWPGAGIGGNALPGANPEVRSVTDIQEAQKLAAFQIKTPAFLPEGYSLREVKLAPVWTGAGALVLPNNPNVFMFYKGPGKDIVLVQQPVGSQPTLDASAEIGRSVGLATNGQLEEMKVRGHTGAWVNGNTLVWEEDGISYWVGGPKLDLDQAMHIAESLK